jgi:hypothetical protein
MKNNYCLEAALVFAKQGFAVFPTLQKIPLKGSNGFYDAATDAAVIRRVFAQEPKAQVAIRTGKESGLFALDLDSEAAIAFAGKWNLPETLTIETRPGRRQLWFAQPKDIETRCTSAQSSVFPGVDTRGDFGYIVAPPSVHHLTGKPYRYVNNAPIAPMPEILLTIYQHTNGQPRQQPPSQSPHSAPPEAKDFKRWPVLVSFAASLRGKGVSPEQIYNELIPYNLRLAKQTGKAAYPDRKLRNLARWFESKPAGQSREPGDEPPEKKGEIITIIKSRRASEIPPEPIDWLWEPYIQRDTLNGLYGNPSVGKGNLGMEIIACLTAPRKFPDESEEDFAARTPINVCVLAAEEGAATTIVPRLIAAGANLDRVRIIESIQTERDGMKTGERMLIFQEDIAHVRADLLLHPEEKLLFVDPATSYIGDCNANQDSEVRPLLQLLLNLAEELKITIIIVGHFNKVSNLVSALDKPSGARAWVAMCRAAWGFFRKPDDRNLRLMANLKLNNAKESSTTRAFTIGEKVIGTKPNGKPWTVSVIEWGDVSEVTADELLAAEQPEAKRDTKGSQFIDRFLAKNGVEQAMKVYDAAEAEKIPIPTLKRASAAMGIIKYEIPGAGGWYWQHPSCQTLIPAAAESLNKAAIARRYRDMQAAKPPPFDNPFDQ